MDEKISLIIPVFNEEDEIENFFNDVKKLDLDLINEIIFIDDCSTDNSFFLLEKEIKDFKTKFLKVKFVLLKNFKNRGYGFSIKKGVDHSNNNSIAIIDLDKTYKIEDLNELSKLFIEEFKLKYHLISGERNINSKNTSKLKILGKNIINKIANTCFDEKIIDYNSGLRIFNRNKFQKHSHLMSDRFSLTTSMTIAFLNEKYDVKFHKIQYDKRSGNSKLGFKIFLDFYTQYFHYYFITNLLK